MEPVKSIVLKLANSCNIKCSYCYWFKDLEVYNRSSLITEDTLQSFYSRLRTHLSSFQLKRFSIILHGGEPLLVGKKRMESILYNLNKISVELQCKLEMSIQTNGILIDNDWVDIFESYDVFIGVSIDGDREVNDMGRLDFRGRSTFDQVRRAIELLQCRRAQFGIISVCSPNATAERWSWFFFEELGVKNVDVLIPNVNFGSDDIPDIRVFFKKLFQLWYGSFREQGISIRLMKNIYKGITGKEVKMQSIGYCAEESVMIKPDGEIEASDSLHAIGNCFTKSNLNIRQNEIQEICEDALWREVYQSSIQLHEKCVSCKFKQLCGGGHICTRWSEERRFDNPSVYCDQLYELFEYAEQLVLAESLTPDIHQDYKELKYD